MSLEMNMPKVKLGIVAVSRDCFPESLSVTRRGNLVKAYKEKYPAEDIYECPICIVESEIHMVQALEDIKKAGCNALCVYLGNFGPEISETLLAKHFDGPKMFVAAAEETGDHLCQGRGDAYCGMLNASYNLLLRNIKAYIPEYPVGDAADCADMIHEFVPIARAVIALQDLKIISFGPRPFNFLACNAPIKQLYNLGVEIEENSELDLFESFNKHEGDERIWEIVKEMEEELGAGNKKPEILAKLAQYELTLTEEVEIRYRTETSTDPETGETTTEEVPYEYYILNVTLTNKTLPAVILPRLNEQQREIYTVMQQLKGNKPYLWEGIYNGGEDTGPSYEIPGEALDDPAFAALMEEATKYIGWPYVWGGSSPSTSFDCSGFVCWVYTASGVHNLPRTTAQGIYNQCAIISPSEAKPGDIIFFTGTYDSPGPVSHVGIYVGDGMMLHCGSPIQYANINSSYWQTHFYAFGRL